MAENPLSHVVSVLKGAIEQIERSQSTSSHVPKSSQEQESIPDLPVSTISRPLPVSSNQSFGQAALRNFRFVILVIAMH